MLFFYKIGIRFYILFIHLASWFGHKQARKWIDGRKGWKQQLKDINTENKAVIWFHCASLGEFEQGRPLIEAVSDNYPDHFILLSFFSPSGYEVRKNYSYADHVCYLPVDTSSNARYWVDTIKPVLSVFVKYEFWFQYLRYLQKGSFPIIYVSATFRKDQYFFKFWAKPMLRILRGVDSFFIQDESSARVLKDNGIENYIISGDTRFDRVMTIAKAAKSFPLIEEFIEDHPVIVVGSSWPPDEKFIVELSQKDYLKRFKWIIAPHDISTSHLDQIRSQFKGIFSLGELEKDQMIPDRFLLIDRIGILSQLYQYAKIAYIGGGFGVAIHNTQEAFCFGVPVVFGPKFEKFKEARDLVKQDAAFTFSNAVELDEIFRKLTSETEFYERASDLSKQYAEKQSGGTAKILLELDKYLTN